MGSLSCIHLWRGTTILGTLRNTSFANDKDLKEEIGRIESALISRRVIRL